jgi:hypothetical protein
VFLLAVLGLAESPSGQRRPPAEAAVERVRQYLDTYEAELGSRAADERFEQRVTTSGIEVDAQRRTLESDCASSGPGAASRTIGCASSGPTSARGSVPRTARCGAPR